MLCVLRTGVRDRMLAQERIELIHNVAKAIATGWARLRIELDVLRVTQAELRTVHWNVR